jgi:two-component system probable response regulator PhcQ
MSLPDTTYDYRRFAILYVDDETAALRQLPQALEGEFRFYTAENAEQGLQILHEHLDDIGLVLSDQQMPGMKGAQFLERVRQLRPRITRMLVTAHSDLQAAIDSVNKGAIYRYLDKPWDIEPLSRELRRGLEYFMVQRERDALLREKLSALHRMVITDRVLSLGVLAAGLGHHVRNAMSAVRTFLDLAPEMLGRENLDLGQLQHPAFWQDFHLKVQHRVSMVVELLDDLSNHAGPGHFNFDTQVSLHEVISSAIKSNQQSLTAGRLSVENFVPTDLPQLRVDDNRFRRLFELLFKDQIANLQPGGVIRCTAKHSPQQPGRPSEVDIVITDNGPGLPGDAIRSVFDPFFVRSGDPQTFGVCLMAVYFLVYHHGGRITVESLPAGGLSFQISIPVEPPVANDPEKGNDFLARVMTNERLWERLLSQP